MLIDHAPPTAPLLDLIGADHAGLTWAQTTVTQQHYLRRPVDARCRPLAYLVTLDDVRVGCLVFGRPESTHCYHGALTYGSQADVAAGRAQYDRWEILNLSRVWLDRRVQRGSIWYDAALLPGFTDRRGVWRSTLATTVIGMALRAVGNDYLVAHPPCFLDEPYAIRAILSYCDTRRHAGTIYRAAGWPLARTNAQGIQTWFTIAERSH